MTEKQKKKRAELARKRAREWYASNRERALERNRKWRASNPGIYKNTKRAWALRFRYGLTTEAVQLMLKGQGGRCAICRSKHPHHKNGWQIDHCHRDDEVRGILCAPCNLKLGMLGDTYVAVKRTSEKMLAYLKRK